LKGIALTGYGMEQDIARSRESGFATHLIKPVRMESRDNAPAAIFDVKQNPVP
jgi:CheY-like chemotaxis protein